MSDEIQRAAHDAIEAADNSEMVRQIAAVLAAQQLLGAQQHACQHPAPRQEFDAKRWIVIGGVAVSVGLVGALFAVAIAIGATCATVCLLILRSVWNDIRKRG